MGSCRNIGFTLPGDKIKLVVKNGLIDLTNPGNNSQAWDWERDGNIKLAGDWEFYWLEFLTASQIRERKQIPVYLEVPGSWNKKIIDSKEIGGNGYATYRLRIIFPDHMIGKILCIRSEYHSSAYKIFVNDTFVQGAGTLGVNKNTSNSVHIPTIGYFIVKAKDNDIVMHFSNFQHRLGGVIRHTYLGTPETINEITNTQRNYDLFSISVLFIIFLYYLFYWLVRRKETSTIIFSLLCFTLMLRALVQNQQLLREVYPEGSYKLFLMIEYCTMYFAPALGIHFFSTGLKFKYKNIITVFAFIVSLSFTVYALLSDTIAITKTVLIYQYIVIIMALYIVGLIIYSVKMKVKYALYSLMSLIALILTIVIDILVVKEILRIPFTSSYGLIVLIFSQGIILAVRFSEAFASTENLTEKLKVFNEELEDKVKIRTEELNKSIIKIERAANARSEFLVNMSHEIRTPMNIISGMAQLLENTSLTEEQKEYVEIFNIANKTLLNTLNDILDLSKIEQGSFNIDEYEFDLKKLILDMNKIFQFRAKDTSIQFLIDFDKNADVLVLGDSNRISQVLFNFLSNAFKFTKKGKILLTVKRQEDGRFSFSVTDTGVGMPKEKQENLFLRFYQAHDTSSIFQTGTGIGLAISKKFVELMKGEIGVESEEGKGTRFYFTIPLKIVQERKEKIITSESEYPELKKLKVLAIDDVKENLMIVQKFLEKSVDTIVVSTGGAEAVRIFEKNKFDVVLLDIQMPEINGFEMIFLYREIDSRRNLRTPIIALTANVTMEEQEAIQKNGFNAILTKPLIKKDLFNSLKNII